MAVDKGGLRYGAPCQRAQPALTHSHSARAQKGTFSFCINRGHSHFALTRENLESLKDYGYFTHVRFAGKMQAMGAPAESGQTYSDDKLRLHFQLPLVTPVDPTKGEFVLKVYDPEFYISFNYLPDATVAVTGNMPKACKPVLKPVPTDAEVEQTRAMLSTKGPDWKPDEQEDFGAIFAQPVTIQCQA